MSARLGSEGNARQASPMSYVTAAAPPALLIHGDADQTVPIEVGRAFHHRLLAAGVPSEFITYPGAGHADILFRALTERPPRLLDDIVGFVRRCTAAPGDILPAAEAANIATT